METLNQDQQRILGALGTLVEVVKTHQVSRIVDSVVSQGLDAISKSRLNSEGDSEFHAKLDSVSTNMDQMKAVFTNALEEAVYGNGGRKQASIKQHGAKTSWQEELKVGPIGLDRRLETARTKVEQQVRALQVDEELAMGMYDIVAANVNAAIDKELKAPAR
jgi:hypothetical protein